MAAVLWQLKTISTATRGHIMPATLPTDEATPYPVVLTDLKGDNHLRTFPVMHMRIPHKRAVAISSFWWKNSGKKNMKLNIYKSSNEIRRPNLSTSVAAKMSPGISRLEFVFKPAIPHLLCTSPVNPGISSTTPKYTNAFAKKTAQMRRVVLNKLDEKSVNKDRNPVFVTFSGSNGIFSE
ncbi:DEAD/H associated domain protein [Striga asiatica]|uniref:DEAD/H associated domain protein n=1 Tax=Striga asiatica TaxID=4170 RepID=A0A5A7Q9X5_STRAF|nr:DEAD/H associated domain protein [Striga asiatica]